MKNAGLANPYAGLYRDIIDHGVKAGLVGLAVYIKTPEEGVWIGTGGYSDLAAGTRVQAESLFYSASHLKIMTATAMMMLWDAGLVDLDTPIARYLPTDIGARLANADTATVRHLLSHTSGIPSYRLALPWGNNPLGSTWRDDIESVLGKSADFRAGTQFQYCNTNFLLAAVIMDQITGDHADFMSRRIFQPLGMTRTYYRNEAGLPHPAGLATPYLDRFDDGNIESVGDRSPAMRQNHAYGAGDVLADLEDHARFIEALFGGELISPEALHMMSTPEGPGSNYGYGLGMIIKRIATVDEPRFGKAHGHGGRGPFGIMEMNYFPKANVAIGFASNYGYPGSERQAVNIFDELEARFGDAVFNKRDQAAGAANLERPASRLSGRMPIRRPVVHKDDR